ncbi:MAG: hypothetical protein H6Q00_2097 [Holophagaceae bacterium]|nr:hypothetical protein [Holophagaceae bacterium]
MEWSLPPELSWPQFLRLLRHPAPPVGWLEAAADLPDLRKRPILLRWIAQHPKSPAHLRMRLLPRLPWRALAAIAQDASAHPQARSHSVERLQGLWGGMTLGERRSFAIHAPRPMWEAVWKVRDTGVLLAFLAHPKLGQEPLCALLQPPLSPFQAMALQGSRWRESSLIAEQVLVTLDQSLSLPENGLVLGMAAPWIRTLSMEERLQAANRLTHPALRRMTRAWAAPLQEED